MKFALIIALQAGVIASIFYSNPSLLLLHTIVTSALVLPFIGYFLAFYRDPALASWSRVAMTLTFIVATIAGFCLLFFIVFTLFMVFGTHIGR